MAVPSTIADLDPVASNNSPQGSDSIGTSLDDYLRAHAAIIKQVSVSATFPSGTRMPFAQASAPTGWTQDTTDAATNRMLRVVNTAGGGVAGSHSPILNNVVPSHTHSFTTGTESSTHTHADSGHSHVASQSAGAYSAYGGPGTSGPAAGAGFGTDLNSITTTLGYANLGAETSTHYHGGTTNDNGSASDWTPRYIDIIICAKN